MNRFIQILSDRLMQPASLLPSLHSLSALASQFGQPVVNIAGSGPLNSQAEKEEANRPFGAGRLTGGVMSNLKAIAIVPATPEINAEAFCLELQHTMSVFGSSVRLTAGMPFHHIVQTVDLQVNANPIPYHSFVQITFIF